MWTAEVVTPANGRRRIEIALDIDSQAIDLTRAICDAVYNTIKDKVIDKDLRDVNRLVDLMTDLHQIIQEESEKERNNA